MWYVEGGCDLEFENMTIDGANTAGGSSKYSADSAIQVSGGQRVLITSDTMNTSYGDCATVFGLHEYATPGTYPASDVTFAANQCNAPGRDGVAIVYANRVSVGGTSSTAGNIIAKPTDSGVDLESDCGNPLGGRGTSSSRTTRSPDRPRSSTGDQRGALPARLRQQHGRRDEGLQRAGVRSRQLREGHSRTEHHDQRQHRKIMYRPPSGGHG